VRYSEEAALAGVRSPGLLAPQHPGYRRLTKCYLHRATEDRQCERRDGYQINGVATIQGNEPLLSPDGLAVLRLQLQLAAPVPALPIHDHRDNITGGGFAFAVYHPA